MGLTNLLEDAKEAISELKRQNHCLPGTPTRSEKGAMMGMVMAALAVALGIRTFITA